MPLFDSTADTEQKGKVIGPIKLIPFCKFKHNTLTFIADPMLVIGVILFANLNTGQTSQYSLQSSG